MNRTEWMGGPWMDGRTYGRTDGWSQSDRREGSIGSLSIFDYGVERQRSEARSSSHCRLWLLLMPLARCRKRTPHKTRAFLKVPAPRGNPSPRPTPTLPLSNRPLAKQRLKLNWSISLSLSLPIFVWQPNFCQKKSNLNLHSPVSISAFFDIILPANK